MRLDRAGPESDHVAYDDAVTRLDYLHRLRELELQFLREKHNGLIPRTMGWADWCWANHVYPLQDDNS